MSSKLGKKVIQNLNPYREYSFINLVLMFLIFSLIGWIWEVAFHYIFYGCFVNRGVLHGPWIPIYGIGGMLILVFLKRFRNNIIELFIATFIVCGCLEYFISWLIENLWQTRYWDYYGYFLNINGRVCLSGLIGFGLAGCLFTYIIAPSLDNILNKTNLNVRKVTAAIFVLLFAFDCINSFIFNPNKGDGVTTNVVSNKA